MSPSPSLTQHADVSFSKRARRRGYLHEIVDFPHMDARLARTRCIRHVWCSCAVPTRAGRSRRRHRVLQGRGRSAGLARPASRCRQYKTDQRPSPPLTSTSTAPLTWRTRRSPTPAQQYVCADALRPLPTGWTYEPADVPREQSRATRWQCVLLFPSSVTVKLTDVPSGLARRRLILGCWRESHHASPLQASLARQSTCIPQRRPARVSCLTVERRGGIQQTVRLCGRRSDIHVRPCARGA